MTSSVDADLSLDSINDFFRSVAISDDHQLASCFHLDNFVGDDSFQFNKVTTEEIC